MPQPPKILVIRRRYLGDVVLLGSVFRNLRLHWPAAHLSALVEAPYREILSLNPDVVAVLCLPQGPLAWPRFLRAVRGAGYTHVLDIDNTEKTALIARMSGAPVRVALHHGSHRPKLRSFYSDVVYDPEGEHEGRPITEYYLKILGPAGVPVVTREVRLVPRESDVADWRRFVGAQGQTLLVHPGSRSPMRIWPSSHFAAVCDRVQDEMGAQVVLVGGPAERALVAEIRGLARSHVLALDKAPSSRVSRPSPARALRSSATTAGRCTWPPPSERRSSRSTAPRTPSSSARRGTAMSSSFRRCRARSASHPANASLRIPTAISASAGTPWTR